MTADRLIRQPLTSLLYIGGDPANSVHAGFREKMANGETRALRGKWEADYTPRAVPAAGGAWT